MNKTLAFGIFCFAVAMTAAHLTVAALSLWVIPISLTLLVVLGVALDQLLHVSLRRTQMAVLIIGSGVLAFALNPAAAIAVAYSVAFSFLLLARDSSSTECLEAHQ